MTTRTRSSSPATTVRTLTLATDFSGADFEGKPSYSLTIVASGSGADDDDRGTMYARLPVTVMVVNAEDRGTVELNAREPQVGRPVLATLDDKDGGVTGVSWKWYRGGTARYLMPTTAGALATLEGRPACDADADPRC